MQKLISVILFICFLSGCAPMGPKPEALASAQLSAAEIESQYGSLSTPEVKEIWGRLNDALGYAGRPCTYCRLTVLHTDKPLAFSAGAGQILVSTGTITRVSNEAEFAFILSHELGHQVLQHTLEKDEQGYNSELESQADRFGAGLMALAGYDPRLASSALTRMGDVFAGGDTGRELNARVHALDEYVSESRWNPPGTVNRRKFQELQRELASGTPSNWVQR